MTARLFKIKDIDYDNVGQAAKEALAILNKNKSLAQMEFSEVQVRIEMKAPDGSVVYMNRLMKMVEPVESKV
jgi:hypothetical protein